MMEKDDVAREARDSGEEIHFARAHSIMVEKHHILDEVDPRRKFKARGVCLQLIRSGQTFCHKEVYMAQML